MAANVRMLRAAQRDVAAARDWYDQQTPGLGARFLAQVQDCVRRISVAPAAHQVVFKTYRKLRVRQFPYAVYYAYNGTTVTIHCVYHAARDPGGWQRRLP